MTSSNRADALFQSAVASGAVSGAAVAAIDIRDIGDEINNALGISVDDVKASEVFLVTILADDSSSIRFVSGNTEAIREGHNLVVGSLVATKQKDGILGMCMLMNKGLLYPFTPIDKVLQMTAANYNPSGGTPLYNKSVEVLAAVLAKCQEFEDAGVPCRTATAILTDGHNEYPDGKSAADVRKIVVDMLRRENHIVAGIGVADGNTDFNDIFAQMGVPSQWILTPKNSPSEIRRAFGTFSQSAVRASQTATFSQTAMGGFAAL